MSRLLSLVLLIATVFVVCQAILPNSPSSDEAPQPNNLLVCEGNCTVASCNACCSGFGSVGLYSEVYISGFLVYWGDSVKLNYGNCLEDSPYGATCENIRNKSLKFFMKFVSTMLTAHRYMSFIKMLNAVMSNHNEQNHTPKEYAEQAR
ncbi:unnamed protein product, partial [Mesorhabditis belari]|uniref:Uncharacterized protein n=1 Tax=Mesorhabditis belari TaxID=2138241 RepID=A0AAF3F8E6_9BILA